MMYGIIVPRPEDKEDVTSKWLYKIKHGSDGSVEKFKARFVARGFSQKEGIDYDDIFAPVARYTTIRSIIALVANARMESSSDGCEDRISAWCDKGRGICGATSRVGSPGSGHPCLQVEENPLWVGVSTQKLVQENR